MRHSHTLLDWSKFAVLNTSNLNAIPDSLRINPYTLLTCHSVASANVVLCCMLIHNPRTANTRAFAFDVTKFQDCNLGSLVVNVAVLNTATYGISTQFERRTIRY